MKGLNAYLPLGLSLLPAGVVGWVVLLLARLADWRTRIAGVVSSPFLLYGFYVQRKVGSRELPSSEKGMLDE